MIFLSCAEIYVENLLPEPENKASITIVRVDKKAIISQSASIDDRNAEIDISTLNLIYKAIKDNSDDEGWASLAVIGNYINNVKPDFDTRTYGRAKLSGLLKKLVKFECKIEDSHMLVRKFNFPAFIDIVRTTIIKLANENEVSEDWVGLSNVIEQLKCQTLNNPVLDHLTEHEIEQKILAIDPKYVNFSTDKSLIRVNA